MKLKISNKIFHNNLGYADVISWTAGFNYAPAQLDTRIFVASVVKCADKHPLTAICQR